MTWIRNQYDHLMLWFTSVSFAWFVALFISFGMRQRMSHNKGVAARGRIRIPEDPGFPDHDFLVPGRSFECRIRHASVSFFDDGMMQVRSISIKFSDTRYRSPWDLELNTGPKSIFWTAANFIQFVMNRREKGGIQYRDYYEKFPDGKSGAQVSGMYHPSSFAMMTYYSKNPQLFTDRQGQLYYAKYRVVPEEGLSDTGKVPEERMETIYDQRVKDENAPGVNYLVNEYRERLKKGPVRYRLQVQLHHPCSDDTEEIFNSFIEWPEKDHPWMDLAHIEVHEPIDYKETVLMGFNVNHHPPTLGHIPARSIHDYNSILYMRSKTWIAYQARRLSYKLFGLPEETPEHAPRNR